jgi:hypothetical protein
MANHRIPCLSKKHRALVKKAQPYNAGDSHPLSILADLSNADKHRILNPTFSVLKSDSRAILDRLPQMYQGDGPSPVESWWMLPRGSCLEHDADWFRIVFDRAILTERVDVEIQGFLRVGIAFGEMGLDADSYRHVAEYVLKIIEAFMRSFPETKYVD